MRVCHITTVHPPQDPRIFDRMCIPLAERGLDVVLIGPWPEIRGTPVRTSHWNAGLASVGRPMRVPRAFRAALAERADVYHFHDPELLPLGLALKVARPSCTVVYDVHEDYPAMMLVKYWIPKALRRIASWGMRLAHGAAGIALDGIVTADPGVARQFESLAASKTLVHYNFPKLSTFASSGEVEKPVADLVYVGGMSERAGTFVLLEALDSLARQGVRPTVRMAGYTDGESGRLDIERAIEKRGLANQIEFHRRLPFSRVPAWIRSGRIGLVTLQPIAKFLNNIPTKLFEYWACELPVIASDLPPIRRFVEHGQNGLLFQPTSSEDLARAIRLLMEDSKRRQDMGARGLECVRGEWNNSRQVDELVRFYERICRRETRVEIAADR